jgi:hypothetical protein
MKAIPPGFTEETDVAYLTASERAFQQAIPNGCSAKSMPPSERQTLGVQALARQCTITSLADEYEVSRKFVYRQAATAQEALDEAFGKDTAGSPERVLCWLPVTKSWLRQAALGLTLICHSSERGVSEFCQDLLGVHLPASTVHNILTDAVARARPYNRSYDLSGIRIPALDEIFQKRHPVLVGADTASTYCFLLSLEEHRDADTWGVRLLELQQQGFAPEATIGDFEHAWRAGQAEALPDVPGRGDVFHVLQPLAQVMTYLDNQAYAAIRAYDQRVQQKTKLQKQGRRDQTTKVAALSRQITAAADEVAQAVALADDVALLARWLRQEVCAVSGLAYADRGELFELIVTELQARAPRCTHRLGPVCRLLRNHREQILAFAEQLDRDLNDLAAAFEVPVRWVRDLLDLDRFDPRLPHRWQQEARLRQQLRQRFIPLQHAIRDLAQRVVRASSVIEKLNSRLRNYFFLRRQLGPDYLVLLQFFLNHRRFVRSQHPERVGKTPAELLTGQKHPHWLQMLGYPPVGQN